MVLRPILPKCQQQLQIIGDKVRNFTHTNQQIIADFKKAYLNKGAQNEFHENVKIWLSK